MFTSRLDFFSLVSFYLGTDLAEDGDCLLREVYVFYKKKRAPIERKKINTNRMIVK